MNQPVNGMQPGMLLEELRISLMKLANDRQNAPLARRCDQLEEEITKRMAW